MSEGRDGGGFGGAWGFVQLNMSHADAANKIVMMEENN
jgi:hypothetical protein